MTPTERRLEILAVLQAKPGITAVALARRLAVSERTARRDVEHLRRIGYGIEGEAGRYGGYALAGGTKLPPLLLDADEAAAVALGLTGDLGVAGLELAAGTALAKLTESAPAPPLRGGGPGPPAPPRVRDRAPSPRPAAPTGQGRHPLVPGGVCRRPGGVERVRGGPDHPGGPGRRSAARSPTTRRCGRVRPGLPGDGAGSVPRTGPAAHVGRPRAGAGPPGHRNDHRRGAGLPVEPEHRRPGLGGALPGLSQPRLRRARPGGADHRPARSR